MEIQHIKEKNTHKAMTRILMNSSIKEPASSDVFDRYLKQ
jgi:hypothetical protein